MTRLIEAPVVAVWDVFTDLPRRTEWLSTVTRVEMLAHFDNTAKNPNNPSSPPRDVRWGEQTTDEMCIGFLQWTIDREHLNNQPPLPAPLLPRLRAAR